MPKKEKERGHPSSRGTHLTTDPFGPSKVRSIYSAKNVGMGRLPPQFNEHGQVKPQGGRRRKTRRHRRRHRTHRH